MKEKLAKLVDVKSIVTIIVTGVFASLSITGHVTSEQFLTIFTMVMAFYFGTQSAKQNTAAEPAQQYENTNVIGFDTGGMENNE